MYLLYVVMMVPCPTATTIRMSIEQQLVEVKMLIE
jgi:hypothetical protein